MRTVLTFNFAHAQGARFSALHPHQSLLTSHLPQPPGGTATRWPPGYGHWRHPRPAPPRGALPISLVAHRKWSRRKECAPTNSIPLLERESPASRASLQIRFVDERSTRRVEPRQLRYSQLLVRVLLQKMNLQQRNAPRCRFQIAHL